MHGLLPYDFNFMVENRLTLKSQKLITVAFRQILRVRLKNSYAVQMPVLAVNRCNMT